MTIKFTQPFVKLPVRFNPDALIAENILTVDEKAGGDAAAANAMREMVGADAAVDALDLQGVIQVASFHPDYQFDGVAADDASNYTNRAPFPTLHLLREDSVARAVDVYPDPDVIVERNIQTLDRIGVDGWHRRLRGEDLT